MIDYIEYTNSFILKDGGTEVATVPNLYPVAYLEIVKFLNKTNDKTATVEAVPYINELFHKRENIANLKTVSKYKDEFKRQPYMHQMQAIETLYNSERKALLLEQGTGKTYIASMAIVLLTKDNPGTKSLVVCPKIVFESWKKELADWTNLRVAPYLGDAETRLQQAKFIMGGEYDVILTTFDMLVEKTSKAKISTAAALSYINIASDEQLAKLSTSTKPREDTKFWVKVVKDNYDKLDRKLLGRAQNMTSFIKLVKSQNIDIMCIDEASRVISPKAARSHAILDLSRSIKRVWLLSGTLCVGRPTDLFMPMNMLSDKILGANWYAFFNYYVISSPYNKYIINGYKNVDKLRSKVAPYIMEKKRADCIDMPDRVLVEHYYDLSSKQISLYNQVLEEDYIDIEGERVVCRMPATKIIKCMQVLSGFINVHDNQFEVCGTCKKLLYCIEHKVYPYSVGCCIPEGNLPKPKSIDLGANPKLELLKEDIENTDGKLIVWAWYRTDLLNIENMLKDSAIPYVTTANPKCAQVFEESPDCKVFLGQTAQGIGITLNSAKTTIYYSHGCALEPRLQSMDRNYRIGQKNDVLVIDYMCKGTIEESVVTLLRSKKDIMSFIQSARGCKGCSFVAECANQIYEKGCIYEGGYIEKQGLVWKRRIV